MLSCLTEADVRARLRWDELIVSMEEALAEFSTGRVLQPVRTVLALEEGKRYLGVMPAAASDVMGLKAVTFYPANAGSHIPTHMAVILLFDTNTGEPLAVMDGRLITEMRTAAVSAAVTKRLACANSRVLALLGSGVQARAHFEALRHVRKFDDVRVWSPTAENARRFAQQYGARATDAESAVRGADVVVTATNATQPVLKGEWLKPGAHVNAVGACRPSWRELDDQAMAGTLIVDSREAVLQESGDVILSHARIYAEAGELFAGLKASPVSDTTVFKSVGIAAEDIAAGRLILRSLSKPGDRAC
ncbi:MAG TPA: ornithine cyclodeaminase family protein [Terriglobales bacterium]|nr:ornithine cyclodeaminase family protein [Terriglobales bacterium]